MVEARVQFGKSADQGYALAQYYLAMMLYKGEGGAVNLTEARVLAKKAADQGHGEAQYNLAKMLRKGEGGPVNLKEARVQYKKSAEQGHCAAQNNLAHMLCEGEDILQQEETARIAFEQLMAKEEEGKESNGKKKKKKKKKKTNGKNKTGQATTLEESLAPSIESLFKVQCSIGGGDALAPSIEPAAAAVCSLKDAGDVTGREVPESSMGGDTTCIVCFEGDKTHVAVPCGHQTLCGPCSEILKACPICRAKAQQWVRVRIA